MSFRDEALEANAAYAAGFPAGERPAEPTRSVAVLACMDARLRPEDLLGLGLGEAHVVRNAGGRVTGDVVRSLLLSTAVLGTREAVVLHHTDCGLLGSTNEGLRSRVVEVIGVSVDEVDFLPFGDADVALREDVAAIAGDPRLRFEQVTGFVVDISSGRLREIAVERDVDQGSSA
jgi:carbonic anhydrase